MTEKPTLSIGETLNDLMFLIFGDLHNKAEMRRIRYAVGLEKFKQELESNINQIPAERLLEPNAQLVLSALDSAKYTVEEENLRKMFARLISKSMDSEYNNYVHPSFVTIIKEMSPLDAENIALFRYEKILPIANFKILLDNQGNQVNILKNIFLSNTNQDNLEIQGASISNLNRLGLLDVQYIQRLSDDAAYDIFYNNSKYKSFAEEIIQYNQMSDTEINNLEGDLKRNAQRLRNAKLEIEKGMVELTELGKNFIKICL